MRFSGHVIRCLSGSSLDGGLKGVGSLRGEGEQLCTGREAVFSRWREPANREKMETLRTILQ